MKKSFFIGLLLFSVVLGFAGCKQPINGPVVTEKRFVARVADKGPYIEYTKIYHDGKFSGKLIVNKIHDGTKEYEINKDCSWEKSGVIFGESTTISGQILKNLEWENGNAWCVNCYNSNYPIKLGDDTLARIYFGWCTSSDKTEKTFIISAVKYLAKGTEDNFLGVTSNIAIPREVTEKRFVATALDNSGLSLEYTETYEGIEFYGKKVMNKITYGNEVFNINKDCTFEQSGTTFNTFKDESGKEHNYSWRFNGCSWSVDCSNFKNKEFQYTSETGIVKFHVTKIEFEYCKCSCGENHYVINVITDESAGNNVYNCWTYFSTLKEIK